MFETLESVETDGRCLVGCFKGADGKEGFMFVNVEDTSKQKTLALRLQWKRAANFTVYKNGEIVKESFDGSTALTLGVGEGIFMMEE